MKKLFPFVGLLVTLILIGISKGYPNWVEFYYSEVFYAVISRFFRLLLGWVPFSVGDLLYTFVGGYVLYFLIRFFKRIWRKPLWFWTNTLGFIAVIITLFYFLWGFNYYRIPLSKQLNVTTTYTENQLFEITEYFLQESNCLQTELMENPNLAVVFPFSSKEVLEQSVSAYDNLSAFYPQWNYAYPSVKTSLYSKLLSYMGYSGYLNPFTNEAQVNSLIVGYQKPITACHEIAHQLGYAAEQEANFIGYLACLYSPNRYFNYSASLFALSYCLSEVRKVDHQRYKAYISRIHRGILENYKQTHKFWAEYENSIEPLFSKGYDAYLKANRQNKGIESYQLVVGLLIGYYQQNP